MWVDYVLSANDAVFRQPIHIGVRPWFIETDATWRSGEVMGHENGT